jgi:CSLREA domain-containing protein
MPALPLLLFGALALLVAAPPAGAATFTVTKTADTADGACDADCSLREALLALPQDSTNVIQLPAGLYRLTIPRGTRPTDNSPGDGTNGNLVVTRVVRLIGAGRDVTVIDARPDAEAPATDRVLSITLNGALTISGVTITGGRTGAAGQGGGILNLGGGLAMTDVDVVGNSAGTGGGGICSSALTRLRRCHAHQGNQTDVVDSTIAATCGRAAADHASTSRRRMRSPPFGRRRNNRRHPRSADSSSGLSPTDAHRQRGAAASGAGTIGGGTAVGNPRRLQLRLQARDLRPRPFACRRRAARPRRRPPAAISARPARASRQTGDQPSGARIDALAIGGPTYVALQKRNASARCPRADTSGSFRPRLLVGADAGAGA